MFFANESSGQMNFVPNFEDDASIRQALKELYGDHEYLIVVNDNLKSQVTVTWITDNKMHSAYYQRRIMGV